jgi:hypothetical protein
LYLDYKRTVQGIEYQTTDRTTFSAFINEVHAQRGKAITVSPANEVIAIAQRIINAIPGTSPSFLTFLSEAHVLVLLA